MDRMDIEIPDSGRIVFLREKKLKRCYDELKFILDVRMYHFGLSHIRSDAPTDLLFTWISNAAYLLFPTLELRACGNGEVGVECYWWRGESV